MLLRVNRKKKRVEYRKEHLDSDGHYRSSPIEDSQARGEARFAVQGVARHRWASQLAREGSPSCPEFPFFFAPRPPKTASFWGPEHFFFWGRGAENGRKKKEKSGNFTQLAVVAAVNG